ncbi:CutA1 divalent ion tolerance domain-containing protein, putative [Eimeria praecox]|uniref:CutA1 divalent ion tolerance domain-containing protein, putative n=1 Tax=Eimeria praecox TaxID=51316 RepID=U6GAW1_9EIME|nr:CutA1 divalent ion tolerance domain-containing protein, putative [Eimeria praecox]
METKAPQCVAEATKAEGLVVGFSTASSRKEARDIAQHLVMERLAACVQIVPEVESVYEWKGEIEARSVYNP